MLTFKPENKGPVVIKAANSNTISDAYRDSLVIKYRAIGNVVPDTTFEFAGKTFVTPIMAGAVGGADKGEDGLQGYAKAINEAGSIYWTGFHDKEAWTETLKLGINAVRVIKPLADNDMILDEIKFDEDHGALAYAMDISHGMTVYGEKDGQRQPFDSKTKEELQKFNEAASIPFILKDVMSVEDATIAAEIGVYGIILSGHNNRFPCAVPPLYILPEVRKAVGDSMKIFVDGGLNNGYDAFKALALGADGVLCARAIVGEYIKSGSEACSMKILQMTAELKGAMANTGSKDLKNINKDCIVKL